MARKEIPMPPWRKLLFPGDGGGYLGLELN